MITLLLILIAGFLKITADTIRVPETMQDSWFKKYIGNWFVDPQISWKNKYKGHNIFAELFLNLFGDLWHSLYTLFLLCYFVALINFSMMEYLNWAWFIGIAYVAHGLGVFIGEELWRGHH